MNQEHIFLDMSVESEHVIALAAIRTDPQGNETARYSAMVSVERSFESILNSFRAAIINNQPTQFVVVGYSTDLFRLIFIRDCAKISSEYPFEGRAWIDLMQVSWPLVFSGSVPDRSLASLGGYYGVDIRKHSTCLDRATAITEIYWRMMDRYDVANKVEGNLRRTGITAVSKAISWLSR